MQSKMVNLQDFSIAGVGMDIPLGDPANTGQKLLAQLAAPGFLDKIVDCTDPETLVSVHANWNEKTRMYTQIFGVPVKGDGQYPDDSVLRVHVLGGPYTVFTVVGTLPEAQKKAWKEIEAVRAKPNWHVTGNVSFEVYGPKSRQDPPEIEIYVPGVLDQ